MGGSSAARICSYVLAFDVMYLPAWIVVGLVRILSFGNACLEVANHISVLGGGVLELKHPDQSTLAGPSQGLL